MLYPGEAVCGGGRCWSYLLKPKDSKGSGPHYSSIELTHVTPTKTRQMMEGDRRLPQTQPRSTQNYSCCAKRGILASAKHRDLSTWYSSIDLANALLSISVKKRIGTSLHSVGMKYSLHSE